MHLFPFFRIAALAVLALFISLTGSAAVEPLDLNNDDIPDIWALVYNAGGISLTGDADGDGQPNAAEAMAGTDPFSPGAVIKVKAMWIDAGGLHLTFPTLSGKRYQVQSSPSLSAPDWDDEGSALAGTGTDETVTLSSVGATDKFYHVVVSDVDTDNDGVSDWEEISVGFDPRSARSSGFAASGDLQTIKAALQASNSVSVTASDASAVEPASGVGTETGAFLIRRSGNLNAITVTYSLGGPATAGVDYETLSGSVTLGVGVNSAYVTVTPKADATVESSEAVILTVNSAAGYNVASPASAAVLISDHSTASGDGVRARYWNNTSSTIPVFTNTADAGNSPVPKLDRVEPKIDFVETTTAPAWPPSPVAGNYFVVRFTGDVLPEFSQTYTFRAEFDRGARLWVNGQLLVNNWSNDPPTQTSAVSGVIELQAGRRYPLVYEFMARSSTAVARLSWVSMNQPDQIIPQNRLFSNAPPQITSVLERMVLKGSGPFSYQITATGEPTSFSATNLPPGWSIDPATGLISGSPTQAGTWDIVLGATNNAGSGNAILKLTVLDTGGGITRDVWTGVPGSSVADVPLATPPTSSSTVSAFEEDATADPAPDGDGDDYASRFRGALTAPATGTYKFWITADHAAELWISDDEHEVNAFKRAEVTAPTGLREWTKAGAGKSPLLWLEAGQSYYVEVRHKESTGADHVSIGWLKPGEGGVDQANAAEPAEVVPGYALSPYAPAAAVAPGALFFASLTPQSGVVTSASGSILVRLTPDETQAVLTIKYGNLTSGYFGMHLHDDRIPNPPGALNNVVCDLDQPGDAVLQPDGTFLWTIQPRGGLSVADIVTGIKTTRNYFNVHSTLYPGGEIKGYLRKLEGSQTFTAPAAPAAPDDDHTNASAASIFLIQSTFGPSIESIAEVQSVGYDGWINAEFAKPPTYHYPYVFTHRNQTDPDNSTYSGNLTFSSWWRNAVTAPDQLRQRVAFALSEILVVSEAGPLDDRADALSDYYDMLLDHSFGNFRELLEAVTMHPAMGRYLDMLRNDKPNLATGRIPNENYAREILQLFSVGLNRMWPDGSLVLNARGEPIPTYDQNAIIGFAHAFTGWDYAGASSTANNFSAAQNWIDPMSKVPRRHFTGPKRILNNVVLPGLAAIGGVALDPHATHTNAQYSHALYQALPVEEIESTHNAIFNHPNVGPFICRQLIQRLVTSTPSRGYIYRVASKFNDNGAGVRGDMKAVIKAILLDYEARSPDMLAVEGYGKQREPVLRVTALARAFPSPLPVTGSYTQSGSLISVTTSTPHLYSNNNAAYLDFSNGSAGDPDDAGYAVSNVATNAFTVRALTSQTVDYSQAGGVITITNNNEHPYNTGNSVFIDFTSGTPSAPADGVYVVTSATSDDIEFTVRPLSAVGAAYSQADNVITVATTAVHPFIAGSSVFLDFTSGTPDSPADGAFTVATVSGDGLQFTVAAADSVTRTGNVFAMAAADAVSRTGQAVTTKPQYVVNRSGSVAVNYSDWNMSTTDTDIGQTPLRSPTVFNFFLPDYQFPGMLSAAGLITPEFELTSDTNVIRQANFLYNGLFSGTLGTAGLESFKSGGRDIILDLRDWMEADPGELPWVHDDNLADCIVLLNVLLTAGQLSEEAMGVIYDYAFTLPYGTTMPIIDINVGNPCELRVTGHGLSAGQTITVSGVTGGTFTTPINGTFQVVAINSSNRFTIPVECTSDAGLNYTNAIITIPPSATQLRDRVRAIVHLIVTSPDFAIQK